MDPQDSIGILEISELGLTWFLDVIIVLQEDSLGYVALHNQAAPYPQQG